MPISSEDYQGLPIKGDPLMQALLPGIEAGMRLKRLPRQLDTELLSKQLENALNQIGLKFAPQRQQADLENTLINNEYKRQESYYMPLEMALHAADSQRANSRFGDVYQLTNMLHNMPPPARAAWLAEHAEGYINMLNKAANAALDEQQNEGNGFLEQVLSQYYPSQSQRKDIKNPMPLPPNKFLADHADMVAEAPDQSINGSDKGKFSPPSQFNITPDEIKKIRLAQQMSANNALITNSTQEQGESAIKMDNFLAKIQPEFNRVANNVAKYSGVIGKGIKFWDSIQKVDPQSYQDYLWLKSTYNTNMEALTTQMEKMSTTSEQQEKYKKMLTDAYERFDTDPQSAIKLMNHLYKTLNDIAEERVHVAQPLYKNTAEEAYNYKGIPQPYIVDKKDQQNLNKSEIPEKYNFTNEEIEYAAKKYGISPEKVRADIANALKELGESS